MLGKLERVSVLQELSFVGKDGKVNMHNVNLIGKKKKNEAPSVKRLALCLVYKETQCLLSE